MDGLLSLLTDKIDGEVMDAAGPQLKVISNLAVGFDNIDVQRSNRTKNSRGQHAGCAHRCHRRFRFRFDDGSRAAHSRKQNVMSMMENGRHGVR